MTRICKAVVTFVLAAILAKPCHAQDWQALADCVVRLDKVVGNAIHGGTGTVVHVSGTTCYVLTAKHVTEGLPNMQVIWRNNQESTGRVVATGRLFDTAILEAPCAAGTPFIPIAEQYAPQGAEVQILGYRGGSHQLIPWKTKVLGYVRSGQIEVIAVEPGSGSGDSGAPMVYNQQLVGVVSGGQLDDRKRAKNTIGAYCLPIQNLLRTVLPNGLVDAIDRRRQTTQQPGST